MEKSGGCWYNVLHVILLIDIDNLILRGREPIFYEHESCNANGKTSN